MTKRMHTHRQLGVSVGVVLAVAGIFSLAQPARAVWSEPSSSPPGGNVAAPLNVSSVTQAKNGSLNITSGAAENFGLKGAARQSTTAGTITAGVWGAGANSTVSGGNPSTSAGVYGIGYQSAGGTGLQVGLLGYAGVNQANSVGVYGWADPAVVPNAYAAYFKGRVNVNGQLCFSDGSDCISTWAGIEDTLLTESPVLNTYLTNTGSNLAIGGTNSSNAKFFFNVGAAEPTFYSAGSIVIGPPPSGGASPTYTVGDGICHGNLGEPCSSPDCYGQPHPTCSANQVCNSNGTNTCVNTGDTTPPSVPANLQVTGTAPFQVDTLWNQSTDDTAVGGYYVYRCNGVCTPSKATDRIATRSGVASTSYSDVTVFSDSQYTYAVTAYDSSGNESGLSNQVLATTPPSNDTTDPSVPQNLREQQPVGASYSYPQWDASTDNIGVAGYKVYRCSTTNCAPHPNGSLRYNGTNTTFRDPVNQATTYRYQVIAYDAALNESGPSNVLELTSESGGGSGCFLPGTLVTMADGTKEAIENIRAGDRVLSYDTATGTFRPNEVTELFVNTAQYYLLVNGSLKVAPPHAFLTNGVWKNITDIEVGDTTMNAAGEEELIRSIERVEGTFTIYNLEVERDHTYIAGGYVVHNKLAKIIIDGGGGGGGSSNGLPLPTFGAATPTSPVAIESKSSGFRPLSRLLSIPTAQAFSLPFLGIPTAQAASPFGGAGTIRLKVNSGVLQVVDDENGTKPVNTLEVGNAGTDIASTGPLWLRPDSSAVGTGVRIAKDGARASVYADQLCIGADCRTAWPATGTAVDFVELIWNATNTPEGRNVPQDASINVSGAISTSTGLTVGQGAPTLSANQGTGRVGIGTATPSTKLHVEEGTATIKKSGASAYPQLTLQDDNDIISLGISSTGAGVAGEDFYIKPAGAANNRINFRNLSNIDALSVDLANARVGIRERSPQVALQVGSSPANEQHLRVSGDIQGGSDSRLDINNNVDAAGSRSFIQLWGDDGNAATTRDGETVFSGAYVDMRYGKTVGTFGTIGARLASTGDFLVGGSIASGGTSPCTDVSAEISLNNRCIRDWSDLIWNSARLGAQGSASFDINGSGRIGTDLTVDSRINLPAVQRATLPNYIYSAAGTYVSRYVFGGDGTGYHLGFFASNNPGLPLASLQEPAAGNPARLHLFGAPATPTQLCLWGSGTPDCRNTWPSGGAGLPSATANQTMRYDGTAWVASSTLTNTGTNIGIGTVTAPLIGLDARTSAIVGKRSDGVNLPGDVIITNGSTVVQGINGTTFTTDYIPGDTIIVNSQVRTIFIVTSNVFMIVDQPFTLPTGTYLNHSRSSAIMVISDTPPTSPPQPSYVFKTTGLHLGYVGGEKSLCLYGTGVADCRTTWPSINSAQYIWNSSNPPGAVPQDAAISLSGNIATSASVVVGQGATKVLTANWLGNGNVGIGTSDTPAAKLTVNRGLANNGNALDAIGAYASSTGSSLYAEQANNTGYAGYFAGRVAVAGGLTLGTQIASRFEMNAGQHYISWEAENSLSLLGTCSGGSFNPNEAMPAFMGTGFVAHLNGCPNNTVVRVQPAISLPAGEWKFSVRLYNAALRGREEPVVHFGFPEVGYRTLRMLELVQITAAEQGLRTYEYSFRLTQTTTVTPTIVNDINSAALYIDSLAITPDNSSFSTTYPKGINTFLGAINPQDAFEAEQFLDFNYGGSTFNGTFTTVATVQPFGPDPDREITPTRIRVYGKVEDVNSTAEIRLVVYYRLCCSGGVPTMTTRTWTASQRSAFEEVADLQLPTSGFLRGAIAGIQVQARRANGSGSVDAKVLISGYQHIAFGLIEALPYVGRYEQANVPSSGSFSDVMTILPFENPKDLTLSEIVLYGKSNTGGNETRVRLVYDFGFGGPIVTDEYVTTTTAFGEMTRIKIPLTDSYRSTLKSIVVQARGQATTGVVGIELFGYEHGDPRKI